MLGIKDIMKTVFFVILVALVLNSDGKVFTRCKLAKELLKTKVISKTFLGNWVCLIEQVSNRNTKAYNVTPGGKKQYGLYQIPQKFCREGKRGGLCNIACESLLSDDITEATVCANYIFELEGFKFWSQWTTRCKNNGHVTTEIYKCPDLDSPRSSPEPTRESPERSMSAVLKYKKRFIRRAVRPSKVVIINQARNELA